MNIAKLGSGRFYLEVLTLAVLVGFSTTSFALIAQAQIAGSVCTTSSGQVGTLHSSGNTGIAGGGSLTCVANPTQPAPPTGSTNFTIIAYYGGIATLDYSLTEADLTNSYPADGTTPAYTGFLTTPVIGLSGSSYGNYSWSLNILTKDTVYVRCTSNMSVVSTYTGPGTFNSVGPSCGHPYSIIFSLPPPGVNNPPTNLTAATTSDPAKINLSWTNNSKVSTGVDIERSTSGGLFTQIATGPSTATTYTDTGLTGSTTYQYRVAAIGTSSNSAYSNVVSLKTPIQKTTLTGLTATRSSTSIDQVDLSWTNNSGTTNPISIERSFGTGPYSVIASISSATTTYTDDLSTAKVTGTNENYRARTVFSDGTYSSYTNISTLSNCISLSGSGPVSIAFVLGDEWTTSGNEPILVAKNIMNGIKSIDPFKTYSGKLSFSIDTKKISQTGLIDNINGGLGSFQSSSGATYQVYKPGVSSIIRSTSSCPATVYIFLFSDDQGMYYAWSYPAGAVSYLDLANSNFANPATNTVLPIAATHELAHAFALINDEYFTPGSVGTAGIRDEGGNSYNFENCSQNPRADYTSPVDGHVYASLVDHGCGTYMTASNGRPYWRPSDNSIMNQNIDPTYVDYSKFNVISCGYIVAALNGQTLNQANASLYYPQCYNLDTAGKNEIPAPTGAPVVTGIVPVTGTPNTFTVSGSGMTTTPVIQLVPAPSSMLPGSESTASVFDSVWNFFKNLIPTAHGQTISGSYEIDDVTSPDGSTSTFTVPAYVPNGTYTVNIAGANSPWTKTTQIITVTGHGTGNPTTAIGVNYISATPVYTCPKAVTNASGLSYMYTPASGNTCTNPIRPTIAATVVGYTCTDSHYTLSGTSCVLNGTSSATSEPSTAIYACPKASGFVYTLNVDTNSCLSPTNTTVLSTLVGYTCPDSHYTLSGQTCNLINGGLTTATTMPAIAVYTCPKVSGYVETFVSSNNSCVADTTRLPTLLGYSCTDNQYTLSGTTCVLNGVSSVASQPATTVYTCPKVSGFVYNLNASNNACLSTSGTSVLASVSHSCPTGYTLTGTMCTTTLVTPKSLTGSNKVAGQVSLTWNNNGGVNITTVSIERSNAKTSGYTEVGTSIGTTYTDTGLSPSTTYYYRVRILFVNGSYGAYSNVLNIKTNKTAAVAPVVATTSAIVAPVSNIATPAATTKDLSAPATPSSDPASSATTDIATPPASITPTPTVVTPPATPVTPTSIAATLSYTCPTGSTLSGTQCTASVLSTTGGVNASKSTTCPEGYSETANLCRNRTTQATTAKVVTYTCKTGLTLNTADNKCYKTTQTSVPATPVYSCAAGYALTSGTMCSQTVSSAFATSTSTADVWNSIGGFFGWIGKWFR